MASWFYAIILGSIAMSLVVGYGSLYMVSAFMFLTALFFGSLFPTGVSVLIYIVFGLSWGKLFYDIFASRKAA